MDKMFVQVNVEDKEVIKGIGQRGIETCFGYRGGLCGSIC